MLVVPTVAFILGLVGTVVAAVRQSNWAAIVNSVGSLVLALLSAAADAGLAGIVNWSVTAPPELTLWLAVAGFLHSLGMLGLYESVGWWDHLTHFVSAALVAALVYAFVLVDGVLQSLGAGPAAVAVTVAVGVGWELLELGAREVGRWLDIDPVLVYYGWSDTALDLAFDIVGAVAVVLLDVRTFAEFVEQIV